MGALLADFVVAKRERRYLLIFPLWSEAISRNRLMTRGLCIYMIGKLPEKVRRLVKWLRLAGGVREN